jgi:GNAT superfamily N-acetyltransferase
MPLGRVLVAHVDELVAGHLQLVPTTEQGEIEIKNMAVLPQYQGSGVGRALVDVAVETCRAEGWSRLVVATAAADIGNLRFYQRVGFRFATVERDAFTPANGYPDPIMMDRIPLTDRVWFALRLDA